MAPVTHLTLIIAVFITGVTAYTNHTVGGKAGWLFDPNTNTSSADYAAWTANQTFELGDYLIFNTNTNQTVILTYNETTYRSCSIDNSSDTDTFSYSQGNQEFGQPLTVAVPLTIEGPNYFFSDASDGVQCLNGLAFGINVTHGVGLPPSLNQPPPPPYVEPPTNGVGSVTPVDESSGANVRGVVCYALMFCGVFCLFLV
ncbi:hypothetical protein M8C21_012545 [Ambrosia artemisiifolia]|uniref:Phytocyanin domain-containing protein n=1 Tax=Ambrosia artemisiifolia TaxID=4212 RepID=A0AAD5G9Y4_AMBAR|nr:hypothetical protein M8C21_012545 [Ambrosia artemisiifolia]